MKKLLKTLIIGPLIGLLMGLQYTPDLSASALNGNYTDLLPIGAPYSTTVISNGSGWNLTTVPATAVWGDAISRTSFAIFEATNSVTISNTVNPSTITYMNQGNAGTTSIPAAWVQSGRTIVIRMAGRYSTTLAAVTWKWDVLLGTTSVLTTGAVNAVPNQTNQYFTSTAYVTVANAGGAYTGSALGSWDIIASSNAAAGVANMVSFSTSTAVTTAIDWTTTLTVRPVFTWGTAASGNAITFTNVTVELLN